METVTPKTINKIPLYAVRTCDFRQYQHLPTSARCLLFGSIEPYRQFLPDEH